MAEPTNPQNANPQMSFLAKPTSEATGDAILPRDPTTEWTSEEAFDDRFTFLDEIHGDIALNQLERDAVDTPEFQRLFRLGQLGFVDLVYPGANHTRGSHSIGVCHWSKKLVDYLGENSDSVLKISRAERTLISLAGLLHDLPHAPFSHDIEKKTHHIRVGEDTRKVKSHYGPYEKHDNWLANPALYVFVTDRNKSVLARVLERYSPAFAACLLADAKTHGHLQSFGALLDGGLWPHFEKELLPQLLFHLLVFEKPIDAEQKFSLDMRVSFERDESVHWGLGSDPKHWRSLHEAWYQPYRHDVVGDTLSADLIDYLMRDQSRLGMKSQVDLRLLSHYKLVRHFPAVELEQPRFRTALDLNDTKRGTFRSERLNDIFRLLDVRHQIHEKAVYHRVVQSAIAMLARSILMMERKPSIAELYGFDENTVALGGDDRFLGLLVSSSGKDKHLSAEAHQSLACKLAERRVYRPLMVIPGDRVSHLLGNLCDFKDGLEQPLRQLAAIVDSPYFAPFFLLVASAIEKLLEHALESEGDLYELLSTLATSPAQLDEIRGDIPKRVILWTTPYKQLYKDPEILVCVGDNTSTLEDLRKPTNVNESLRLRIEAGMKDAETKNEGLWKFYVFLSDGLFYTGALAKILPNHPCNIDAHNHKKHLDAAERVVVHALRFAWRYWQEEVKSIDLTTVARTADLRKMLPMFVSEAQWKIPTGVSAVKTNQYLHGDDSSTCRDVRYKFDATKLIEDLLDQVPENDRDVVQQAVRAIGLHRSVVKSEEMAEIVSVFAAVPDALPKLIETAARGSAVDPESLRTLWLGKLKPLAKK